MSRRIQSIKRLESCCTLKGHYHGRSQKAKLIKYDISSNQYQTGPISNSLLHRGSEKGAWGGGGGNWHTRSRGKRTSVSPRFSLSSVPRALNTPSFPHSAVKAERKSGNEASAERRALLWPPSFPAKTFT